MDLKRIYEGKVFANEAAKATPPLTFFSNGKAFTAAAAGPPPPVPRRKTQTIDVRM